MLRLVSYTLHVLDTGLFYGYPSLRSLSIIGSPSHDAAVIHRESA